MTRVLSRSLMVAAATAGWLGGCGSFGATPLADAGAVVDGGDASSAADASGDGDGNGGPPGACAPLTLSPVFAARFDAAEPEPFGFSTLLRASESGKQEFTVDPGAGRSGGGLVVVIRDGATTSHNTWLTEKIARPSAMRRVRLDFDFRIVAVAHAYSVMGALFFDPGNANGVALRSATSTVRVGLPESYGKDNEEHIFPNDVVGAWHHATTCIEISPSSSAVARRVVLVDDAVLDDAPGVAIGDSQQIDARIGLFFTNPRDGETRVVFDGVEVRVE